MASEASRAGAGGSGASEGSSISWLRGEMLGHGSMGRVFKAIDQKTGHMLAVKEVGTEDSRLWRALKAEIRICRELQHPRIVSYLGHDHIGGAMYIYLEYMPGGSVAQVLSQFGKLGEALVASYSRQLLEGLAYMHTRAPVVLHRDIKGANILVGLDCGVKLSDFGCSKRAGKSTIRSLRGSIPWMAPEVILQTGCGRRSDVWSVGCVVIEMLSAALPWGSFDNPLCAMMRIGTSGTSPPLPEGLSSDCASFIGLCTQPDMTQRPLATELLQHVFVDPTPLSDETFCGNSISER